MVEKKQQLESIIVRFGPLKWILIYFFFESWSLN